MKINFIIHQQLYINFKSMSQHFHEEYQQTSNKINTNINQDYNLTTLQFIKKTNVKHYFQQSQHAVYHLTFLKQSKFFQNQFKITKLKISIY